jgi:hypothetical protein
LSAGRRQAPSILDWSLLAAGVVVMTFFLPHDFGGDGHVRHAALLELADGRVPETKYSLVQPLLALPLHWLGEAFGSEEAVVLRFNSLVFVLGLFAFWLLLRPRVSAELLRSFLLLLVFGSMFSAHVTLFYGETLSAVLLACGLLAAVAGSSAPVRTGGWAAAAIGTVNMPAAIPALALAAALVAIRRRSWWPLAAPLAAAAAFLLDVRLRTGDFGDPYADDRGVETVLPYSGLPGFSYPAFFGVLVILFSFGKGLLFFTPGLFLPFRRALRAFPPIGRTQLVWIVVVAGLVLVYCRWWAWYGGFYWGPRFFLFASIPAALALTARLVDGGGSFASRLVTLLALALSVWVAVSGAFGPAGDPVCVENDYSLEFLCWYAPEFSVLWRPFVEWPDLDASQVIFAVLALVVFLRLALPFAYATGPTAASSLARLRNWTVSERW